MSWKTDTKGDHQHYWLFLWLERKENSLLRLAKDYSYVFEESTAISMDPFLLLIASKYQVIQWQIIKIKTKQKVGDDEAKIKCIQNFSKQTS